MTWNPRVLRWQLKVLAHRARWYVPFLFKAPLVFENWACYLALGLTTTPHVLRLRNGRRFLVRPGTSDRSTVSEMFIQKTYEHISLGYVIRPGDVVLDVGANIGAFSVFAAFRAPDVTVYALEPLSEIFHVLQKNIEMNGHGRVIGFKLAMDGTDGERTLYAAGSNSSFVWSRETSETVKTVSLKSFMNHQGLQRIDFLKMDCEGAEFDILFNADAETLSKINRIALEFHNVSDEKHATRLCAFLERNGFRIDVVRGEWNGLLLAKNIGQTVPLRP